MNQRGFIPIIYLIIGAAVIASAIFGTVYKDELATTVSKVIKPKIVVYNIVPAENLLDEQLASESIKKIEPAEKLTGESTNIIEKLKKEIETLKKQAPSIIYKEVIKEVPAPTSGAPTPEPEIVPLSTPLSRQGQSDTVLNTSGQMPDLIIQSSAYYPLTPISGNIMTFFATIKNNGDGAANSCVVSLNIDRVVIGKTQTIALLSNKAETITWGKTWEATAGSHKIEVCVDADSEITESGETNNCYSFNFFVSKTASFPDYIIDSATMAPVNPTLGDVLSFMATIYNQGNADGPSFFTSLKIDEDNDGTWNIVARNAFTDMLAQKDSQKERWDFAWASTKSGTHKYEICADATSLVRESNETNNCTSKTFTIP